MAQMNDISDIASLAVTLHRTANSVSHFSALCEQKDEAIAARDAEIKSLQEQLAAKKGK